MKLPHIKFAGLSFVCMFLVFSCTKEITVNVAFQPEMVIYGELRNLEERVMITIQQSVALNSNATLQSVNDAQVSLFQKNANGTSLVTDEFMVDNGVYISVSTITASIGNAYWIEVGLSDGTQFRSEEEVLLPVVPIGSIAVDTDYDDVLNIDFKDPAEARNFYQTTVRLYNNGQLVSYNTSESNDVLFDGNSEASLSVDLFSNLDDDQALPSYDRIEASLGNVNATTYRFLLNQRAHLEANEDGADAEGGDPSQLFSTPPVSLLGNITNVNTGKTALGNFTVVAIDRASE